MSAFASARSAAIVERAIALPRHDAIRQLVTSHDAASPELQSEIVMALAEALLAARSNPIVRDILVEHVWADDVECGWRWGASPEVDVAQKSVTIPVLFGRRSLRLCFPLVDLIGMANSFLSGTLRSHLSDHLASDAEVVA